VHKARNVVERCPKKHVAGVKRALRQAWEEDDADKAERQLKDLATRIEREAIHRELALSLLDLDG
jgi:hypothetical protein